MDALIGGLHHVTATVTDAQEDLDFYVGLLGQRLVMIVPGVPASFP